MFLKPWLQYIGTVVIPSFPIGAREDNKTVPIGNNVRWQLFTALSVIVLFVLSTKTESHSPQEDQIF